MVSELRVEDLREHLPDAVSNITEILSIEASHTFWDARGELRSIGDCQTECARHELTVLLIVIELSELSGNSVEVREIAETILKEK
jgi:hypothetical protein